MQSNAKRYRGSAQYPSLPARRLVRSTASQRAQLRNLTLAASPRVQAAVMYRNPRTARRVETGFVDTNMAGFELNASGGGVLLINAVPNGTGVTQRIGKKISLKSVQLRCYVRSDGPTFVAGHGYVAIVYDRRPQGTLPGRDSIYNGFDPVSMSNDQWSGRFKILKRWDFDVSGNIASVANVKENSVEVFNEYVSTKGLVTISKTGGTGAIGDLEQGALYLIFGSDQPSGTTLKIYGNTRVRFVDN